MLTRNFRNCICKKHDAKTFLMKGRETALCGYGSLSQSGNENFEKDYERAHLKTSSFQKFLLGVGSAAISLWNPMRADMIAVMGETTGDYALRYMRDKMLESSEGQDVLREKPRINSFTVDLEKLRSFPEGTLGKAYSNFLEKNRVTPDSRMAVQFVDDLELAYVIQRYREAHDLFHTILGMPTNMLGEVTVKWVEAIQTRLPMCVGGALFGAVRLAPKCLGFSHSTVRTYSTKRKVIVDFEPKVIESIESAEMKPKEHPGRTQMPPIEVPKKIQETILQILEDQPIKHLIEDGKSLDRFLQGRKPPPQYAEIKDKTDKIVQRFEEKFYGVNSVLNETDTEKFRRFRERYIKKSLSQRLYNWKPVKYDLYMCYRYLVGRSAVEYATVTKILTEIHKRDVNFKPRTLLDFGSGVGTVTWAVNNIFGNCVYEYFCVDSSGDMNDLALLLLQEGNPQKEPFVKSFYQRQFLPALNEKKYDLVVSAFSLMEFESSTARLENVLQLWNKTKGYLILIEEGTMSGFQVITEARDFLLHLSENIPEAVCHVFAPCPHEFNCPRLKADDTPCNFLVGYKPLKLTNNKSATNEAKYNRYSYVVVKRGERAENDPEWSRIVRPVLLRSKHAICRLCTPAGNLDEVIITKSKHGKCAYQCAKNSGWGDLFPATLSETEE